MKKAIFVIPILIAVTVLIMLGCQGSPSAPDIPDPDAENLTLLTEPAQTQSGQNDSGQSGSGQNEAGQAGSGQVHHGFGYSILSIDTENMEVDVIPLRSSEWHFNMTGVLNATMGVSAAIVPGETDPPNGKFALDITLTHPFATKPQFAGFDVKGILITPGTLAVESWVFADLDETCLLNADGFSRWWNPVEFTMPGIFGYIDGSLTGTPSGLLTATVNPYKLFADRLGPQDTLSWVTDEPWDTDLGRAVFKAGESNTRRYDIRFPLDPGPVVRFGYAIDCSWQAPSPNPPGEVPDDFPPEANVPEAYHVVLHPTLNSLYYDTEAAIGGGVLRMQVNVHDWQGQWGGDIVSEVNAVRIYAPGLMSGSVEADLLNATTMKARYTADLTGLAVPTEAGEALVICEVESSDGSTYQQAGAPAPTDPISAFQVTRVEINDPTCEADTNNDWLDAIILDPSLPPIIDQVCQPHDQEDYYLIDVPYHHSVTGDLVLHCETDQTRLSLYDTTQTLMEYVDVSGGEARMSLDTHAMHYDHYYVRVKTTHPTEIALYVLEIEGEMITPDSPLNVTPPTLHCDPVRVWIHENYLILGGKRLWIYDISAPHLPVFVHVEDILIDTAAIFDYPHLYFGDSKYLHYVDMTDPTSPVYYPEIIENDQFNDFAAFRMNSTHLYASVHDSMMWSDYVDIYDYASSPTSPVFADTFIINGQADSITLLDPEGPATKLVTAYSSAVESWDVEDPSNVTSAGMYMPATTNFRCITSQGNYVYAAGFNHTSMLGFLDVIEQVGTSLNSVGTTTIPDESAGIDVEGPYVCIGSRADGRTVCNVETPTAPTVVHTVLMQSYGTDVFMDDGIACIIPENQGFEVFDYTDPINGLLYRKGVVNQCSRIIPRDDYLIAVDFFHGIKVVDISDPIEPVEYTYPIYPGPWTAEIDGNAMIAPGYQIWWIFDLTTLIPLNLVCSQGEAASISCIGLYGNTAYIGFYDHSVKVYDVTTLSTPTIATTITLGDTARDFAFSGDYMYVTSWAGIETWLISNPLSPVYQGVYSPSMANYNASMVHGNLLYIVTKLELEIASLSNPASPVLQGNLTLPAPSNDGYLCMTIDGPFLYTAGDMTRPVSTYIWPTSTPETIDYVYPLPSYGPQDVYTDDGLLFVGTAQRGMLVYDLY